MIPQSSSSYEIHETCQIENLGWLLEQLPKPFGIFDPDYRGRIVEVGAFDGVTYSNTYGLIKAGWRTIMIEPMPLNIEKCRLEHQDRPWVTIEPVGCGERDEMVPMFFEREGSRIAKTDDEKLAQEMIHVVTLDSILHGHQWQPDFDMLVIDTEDMEQPVLKGFSLDYWQPRLCIIETHHWQRRWIYGYFQKFYRIYSEDGLNTLFVRRDWSPGGEHPSPWPEDATV